MGSVNNLDRVVALSRNELASDLEPAEIERLASVAELVTVSRGERLFELGEPARALLLVARGSVALTLPLLVQGDAREVTIDEKGAGSIIAWSALVPPYKFTLSGKATSDTLLMKLEQNALNTFLEAHPETHRKVLSSLNRVIAGRLAVMEGLLVHRLQQWINDRERG